LISHWSLLLEERRSGEERKVEERREEAERVT
jgi:hypothetical protein